MTSFQRTVEDLVAQIPPGRVMTYGQLALLAGKPNHARIVGWIANYGDPRLPWHRVVNASGGLAVGYPGGRTSHREHLEVEGIDFRRDKEASYFLDLDKYQWHPSNNP